MGGKKFLWFVFKTVLIVFVALLAAKVPQIIVANCGFMVNSDMGYVWVINFVIAFVVTWIVQKRIIDAGISFGAYYAISAITFIVVTVLCESLIWHPREIGTIIVKGITLERVICVVLGILASVATSFIEQKIERKRGKPAKSAKYSRGRDPKHKAKDT